MRIKRTAKSAGTSRLSPNSLAVHHGDAPAELPRRRLQLLQKLLHQLPEGVYFYLGHHPFPGGRRAENTGESRHADGAGGAGRHRAPPFYKGPDQKIHRQDHSRGPGLLRGGPAGGGQQDKGGLSAPAAPLQSPGQQDQNTQHHRGKHIVAEGGDPKPPLAENPRRNSRQTAQENSRRHGKLPPLKAGRRAGGQRDSQRRREADQNEKPYMKMEDDLGGHVDKHTAVELLIVPTEQTGIRPPSVVQERGVKHVVGAPEGQRGHDAQKSESRQRRRAAKRASPTARLVPIVHIPRLPWASVL